MTMISDSFEDDLIIADVKGRALQPLFLAEHKYLRSPAATLPLL